jgi:hypothetical protein
LIPFISSNRFIDSFKFKLTILKFERLLLKVDNRDREIERLNRLFDGGRSFNAVSLEAALHNNEKLIAHQNLQVISNSLYNDLPTKLRYFKIFKI